MAWLTIVEMHRPECGPITMVAPIVPRGSRDW